MAKQYGWCYDKHGNKKTVYPPVYSNGKTATKPKKTATSAIPDSVGFSAMVQANIPTIRG